jgi:hypothetical protein
MIKRSSIVLLLIAVLAMIVSTVVVAAERHEQLSSRNLRSLQSSADLDSTKQEEPRNVVEVSEEDFDEENEDDEDEPESGSNGRSLLNGPQIGADKSKPPGINTWRTGKKYKTLKVVQGTYVIFSWLPSSDYHVIMVNPGDDFNLCKSYNGGDITTGNKVEFDTKHYNGETLFFVGKEADCKKGQKLKLVIIPK